MAVLRTGGLSFETLTAGAAVAVGELLFIQSDGDVELADADTGTLRNAWLAGVAKTAATIGNPVTIVSTPGVVVPVVFAVAPPAANNGLPCYVSGTAGQATHTAPTGASTTTFVVGIIQGADGVATTVDVMLQPQFVSKGAQVT